MSKNYIIYRIEVTEAKHSIDGKRHRHKYYYYPVPDNLKRLGFSSNWSYQDGKKGAIKFTNKTEAQRVAKRHGAIVEEV